jgi:chromosome segregation ATPase
MAKQNQTEQQEKSRDTAQIESERAALLGKIQAVLTELAEIGRGIEHTKRVKIEAKASYSSALDAGDEDLMSEALSRCRQVNSQRQSVIDSLSGFPGKITAVQAFYTELMKAARLCWSNAEEKLKAAQAEYKTAELAYDRCKGLLNEMNSLDRALIKIKDDIQQQEPPAKVASEQIEGNT